MSGHHWGYGFNLGYLPPVARRQLSLQRRRVVAWRYRIRPVAGA